jgi:hypothetical protein
MEDHKQHVVQNHSKHSQTRDHDHSQHDMMDHSKHNIEDHAMHSAHQGSDSTSCWDHVLDRQLVRQDLRAGQTRLDVFPFL